MSKVFIICGRADNLYEPIPGSGIAKCEICRREVNIAPSGMKEQRKNPRAIGCFECYLNGRIPPSDFGPLTPDQIKELTPKELKLAQEMYEATRPKKPEAGA